MSDLSRRQMLTRSALAMGAGAVAVTTAAAQTEHSADESAGREPFGYCLNTSTIRGDGLGLVEKLEIAARAGYRGIEPWIREIQQYTKDGGTLDELRKRIADLGLSVESAIGFAKWIVDDPDERAAGLEEARRDMELLAAIGGKRIAAPPNGARDRAVDLLAAAARYRALLELGEKTGVVPQVEVWGFSKSLGRLGEAALVAIEAGHPQACILPDVYHVFKGGSDFHGLKLIDGAAIQVFHVNDYPAQPPRAEMNDAHRVFPGDGVAPLGQILRDLRATGSRCMLSLELFNRDYWQRDPLQVAREGLEKTRAAVQAAFES